MEPENPQDKSLQLSHVCRTAKLGHSCAKKILGLMLSRQNIENKAVTTTLFCVKQIKGKGDALDLQIFLSKADFNNSQFEKLQFHFHKQTLLDRA